MAVSLELGGVSPELGGSLWAGEWGEAEPHAAVGGGGLEGRPSAALICKQKERRDPNKRGRSGGTPRTARRPAPLPAPLPAAPLTWRTSLAT